MVRMALVVPMLPLPCSRMSVWNTDFEMMTPHRPEQEANDDKQRKRDQNKLLCKTDDTDDGTHTQSDGRKEREIRV